MFQPYIIKLKVVTILRCAPKKDHCGFQTKFEGHFLIEWLFLFEKSDNISNVSFITFFHLKSLTVRHICRRNILSWLVFVIIKWYFIITCHINCDSRFIYIICNFLPYHVMSFTWQYTLLLPDNTFSETSFCNFLWFSSDLLIQLLYFFSYSTNLERYLSVNIRLNHMNRFNLIGQRCLTIGSFICSSLISIYTFIHTCIYLYLRVGGGERKGNRQ